MGWFQHGSTIIALVPESLSLAEGDPRGKTNPDRRGVVSRADMKVRGVVGIALCVLAAVNITAWSLGRRVARASASPPPSSSSCRASTFSAARSAQVFPVYDIPRRGLTNSWVSSVLLGRTVATLAELAFAAQFAVYLHASELEWVRALSLTIVPLIVIAEIFSWHAVLTLAGRTSVTSSKTRCGEFVARWSSSASWPSPRRVAGESQPHARRCGSWEVCSTSRISSSSTFRCTGRDGSRTRRCGGST